MNDPTLPTALNLAALDGGLTLVAILGAITASLLAIYVAAHLTGFVFRAIGAVVALVGGLVGRVGLFVGKELQDTLHLVGGVLTGAVIAPLVVANAAIGRFDNARHLAGAFGDEALSASASLYRVVLGNPCWFLGLSPLTDGLERRLPALLSSAPLDPRHARSRGRRSKGALEFEGYTVTGELEPGGSGARLLLAMPDEATLTRIRAAGHPNPGQVVLKSFDLGAGSTVPQIVRESRSLEAARKLGLVLDHHLDEVRFWYAMPYVPGEGLDVVTRRLHARAGSAGLDDDGLARVLGYTSDLLATLSRFHDAGLWHKDIKPGNLIVTDDRAQLVDLGLVTPLASAMTLTTHGTEYFRDPELVRKAISGARVQDVDGVKFDLYSVGAVVYSMLENSFPAHGNLSRLEKRCPEALAFVVRRAMADLSQRYGSAEEMSRDIDALLATRDPWAVKPADLPSLSGAPRARRASRRSIPVAPRTATTTNTNTAPRTVPADTAPARPRGRGRGPLQWAARLALFVLMFAGITVLVRTARARTLQAGALEVLQAPKSAAPERAREAALAGNDLELLGSGGRVLLLNCAALDARHPDLESLRRVLTERGHELVGEDAGASSIELVARARAAAGLADLSDPRGARRLQAFVDDTEGLDALVWLGPGSGDGIGYRIFVRR